MSLLYLKLLLSLRAREWFSDCLYFLFTLQALHAALWIDLLIWSVLHVLPPVKKSSCFRKPTVCSKEPHQVIIHSHSRSWTDLQKNFYSLLEPSPNATKGRRAKSPTLQWMDMQTDNKATSVMWKTLLLSLWNIFKWSYLSSVHSPISYTEPKSGDTLTALTFKQNFIF